MYYNNYDFTVTELVPSDRIPFETPREPWHKGDHSSQQLVCC